MTAKKLRLKKKLSSSIITLGSLAKSLASNELKIREYSQRDVKMILTEKALTNEDNLDYNDILGICKGLHYSLWMQDKLIRKEEVVGRICDILTNITSETICSYYFQAVFETLTREWDKMDKWQEDKFMLLSRDFFTRGLHHFPVHNPKLWHGFVSAIFDKILNADIYHAVSLKMHMCNVLSEELAKKRVKAVCIVSTLSNCIQQLIRLPKHNFYAHSMLRLIQNLQRIIKGHSAANLTHVLKQVDGICNSKTPYHASVLRLAKFLHSLERKKLVLHGGSALHCNASSSISEWHSENVVDMHVPNHNEDNCEGIHTFDESDNCSIKETSISLKRPKRSAEKIKERKFKKIKSICPPVTLSDELPECPMDLLCSDEVIGSPCTTIQQCEETINSSLPDVATSIVDEPTESTTPQRRVSFGKVYRKKFLSSRRLPLTPTLLSTPSKGILRGACRRISL